MKRTAFDPSAEPGSADAQQAAQAPRRLHYACAATGCPMPGSVFDAGASRGTCAWHTGEPPEDWPRISRTIEDWRCVADRILDGRALLADPRRCTNGKAATVMHAAWQRLLREHAPAWWPELAPRGDGADLGRWLRQLERFLSDRIDETLGRTQRQLGANVPSAVQGFTREGVADQARGDGGRRQWAYALVLKALEGARIGHAPLHMAADVVRGPLGGAPRLADDIEEALARPPRMPEPALPVLDAWADADPDANPFANPFADPIADPSGSMF